MNTPSAHKVIIVGSGPAGWTAAIYAARANLAPVLFKGPLSGGQLTTTTEIENFPGFPEGIQGPELMALFEKQAARFGTKIMTESVVRVETEARPISVFTDAGREHRCEALILATGANPRLLGVKGEKELMGYGVSTCATCDGAFFRGQEIAVVGGGDSACEEALFLTRFGSKVYLVHRRGELRASKIMRERVLRHEKIEPVWHKQVKEIHGSKESGVTHLTLADASSGATSELRCSAVFIAIGHIPNSELLKGRLELDQNGYIIPKPNSTATALPGVFACGDVQDHVFRQAITAAGSGCMAAIEVERWLEERGE